MSIAVRKISKNFGSFTALDAVDLDIPRGRLVALLGPSGSGKTTLLRIIAGLESADSGSVQFDGEDFSSRSVRDRRVGFVFQHYALFRHMTVFENVAFGLRVRPRGTRPSPQRIRERVNELLELIQLQNQAQRFPSQLSGGQRQRVALARALAVEPSVLLLDEPFGALDAKVRLELRRWLRQLHDEVGVTSVFVTHDQDEALEVADQVAVMNGGRIEQVGTPDEVYHRPASSFVYNFWATSTSSTDASTTGRPTSTTRRRDISFSSARTPWRSRASRTARNYFRATTKHINAAGPSVKVEAITDWGAPVHVEIPQERFRALALHKGEEIFIMPRDLAVFSNDTPH